MSQRNGKQPAKRTITHKRITADDNFVDSAPRGQLRQTPAFAGFVAQKDKSDLNEAAGIQCRLVDFIVSKNQQMHNQIRHDALTGKGKYLSSESSAVLSDSLPAHLSGNVELVIPLSAYTRIAFDDLVTKEVWYAPREEGGKHSVGQLKPLLSVSSSGEASSSTSCFTGSEEIKSEFATFDPSCEGIRIPIMSQCIDPARIATLLHRKLLLGYNPVDGHAALPQRVVLTTNPDRNSTYEISALITFNEAKRFEDPAVQTALKAIKSLGDSLYVGEGRSALLGDPQIVRFAEPNTVLAEDSEKRHEAIVAPQFNSQTLPDIDYSLILRNVVAPPGFVVDRLTLLATHGFVNYIDSNRYQNHLTRAFRQGHRLVAREFDDFLKVHLRTLTEGYAPLDRELSQAFDDMNVTFGVEGGNNGSGLSESGRYIPNLEQAAATRRYNPWMHVERRVSPKIQELTRILSSDHKHLGFTAAHPQQLLNIIQIASGNAQYKRGDGLPFESNSRFHRESTASLDPARLLREAVHRHVMLDSLSALSDVHWNSYASLRLKVYGAEVVVGDLVVSSSNIELPYDDRMDFGACDAPRDYVPSQTDQYLPRWGHHLGSQLPSAEELLATGVIKRVETQQEARRYHITDVVLPKLGRGHPSSHSSEDSSLLFPSHKVGKEAFGELAGRLRVGPASSMKMGPWATYRRLVERPMLIMNDQTTQVQPESSLKYAMWNDSRGAYDDPYDLIPGMLIADHEGLRRIRTPYQGDDPHIVRRSIKIAEAREALLSLATDSLSVLLKFRLRRGVALHSMLREPFQVKSLYPERLWTFGLGERAVEAKKKSQHFVSYSKAKKQQR